jgi:hypothetical protein
MKFEEEVALAHLRFRGYEDVRPHPDGRNRPPDLLVDGTIAVEVRRLNQNERGRETPKGLEEEAIPFTDWLNTLLAAFGTDGPTRWVVKLRLKRPLPTRHRLRDRIRRFLQAVNLAALTIPTSWACFGKSGRPSARPGQSFDNSIA